MDSSYWNERYIVDNFPWDLGKVSQPLEAYFDQLTDKNLKILVPGAGNAHEVEYLFNSGFHNVHLLDWAENAVQNFLKEVPDFPKENIYQIDFFEHDKKYDLIVEQTFFCALRPEMRPRYVKKMSELLQDGGKIAGLLFDFPLTEKGPPFGGCSEEYLKHFEPYFEIDTLERSYNSEMQRWDKELFIIAHKK